MPRTYALPGPVPRSLEVVGDRWTLLLVRELLLGGSRYGELEHALGRIPTNLLAQRLRLLEQEGLIERTADRAYALTPKGRDLAPVLAGLATWAQRHYGEPQSAVAVHAGCGGRTAVSTRCARCGGEVAAGELELRSLGGHATVVRCGPGVSEPPSGDEEAPDGPEPDRRAAAPEGRGLSRGKG